MKRNGPVEISEYQEDKLTREKRFQAYKGCKQVRQIKVITGQEEGVNHIWA